MNTENDKKGAAVKFPPPLIFLAVIIAAYGLNYFWPMGFGVTPVLRYFGIPLAILAIAVVISISRNFKHAETSIEPWKPTTQILSTGIYAYSRNPIYLSLCLVQISIAVYLNNLWILASFIVSVFLVYHIAIKKEEIYLETKFGEDYIQYKNKVRRWL